MVFLNMHIYQIYKSARGSGPVNQHDDTLRFYVNNAIYIALLCILPYLHSTPM